MGPYLSCAVVFLSKRQLIGLRKVNLQQSAHTSASGGFATNKTKEKFHYSFLPPGLVEPPSPPVQYKYPVSYQNVNYITDQETEVFYLKSSLRKPSDHHPPTASEDDMGQNGNGLHQSSGGKKVHWTDACGKELTEIREFEVSDESASDSEEESRRGCTCAIM
ncbi:hypothetical protein C5167_042096 [Papaver somniferum]|nr:hypothetical protein C5167_042096 [Papaver somniferum]